MSIWHRAVIVASSLYLYILWTTSFKLIMALGITRVSSVYIHISWDSFLRFGSVIIIFILICATGFCVSCCWIWNPIEFLESGEFLLISFVNLTRLRFLPFSWLKSQKFTYFIIRSFFIHLLQFNPFPKCGF